MRTERFFHVYQALWEILSSFLTHLLEDVLFCCSQRLPPPTPANRTPVSAGMALVFVDAGYVIF